VLYIVAAWGCAGVTFGVSVFLLRRVTAALVPRL